VFSGENIGPNRRDVHWVQLTGCAFLIMREANDNSGDYQPREQPVEIQAVADPNTKRRGESAEAEFISRAIGLGFSVLKPWGDSDRYDIAIDHGQGFWRVQVKFTACHHRSEYLLKLAHQPRMTYTPAQIDFVAGCIGPLGLWYIVPIEMCDGKSALYLCPEARGKSKYERYREAWCLLDCTRQARGWKDIPAVCRCQQLAVRCAVCPLRK
jgi:PD-(D/E)XK nuclease superfamily protein